MADQHLDVLARRMGYPSFAAYQAYQAKQRTAQLNNGLNGTGAAQGQAATPAPKNFFQRIPLHPSYLLQYVNDKMSSALGGQ